MKHEIILRTKSDETIKKVHSLVKDLINERDITMNEAAQIATQDDKVAKEELGIDNYTEKLKKVTKKSKKKPVETGENLYPVEEKFEEWILP